jgi:DNA-directed RNA polymerase specialized sigma subunit
MGSEHNKEGYIMNAERKYIREVVKKSLATQFNRIVSEAKLTEQEEEVVRMVIIRKASTVETSLKLNISESTVCRIMREFYERAAVILES